jgi:hypothetical protein
MSARTDFCAPTGHLSLPCIAVSICYDGISSASYLNPSGGEEVRSGGDIVLRLAGKATPSTERPGGFVDGAREKR